MLATARARNAYPLCESSCWAGRLEAVLKIVSNCAVLLCSQTKDVLKIGADTALLVLHMHKQSQEGLRPSPVQCCSMANGACSAWPVRCIGEAAAFLGACWRAWMDSSEAGTASWHMAWQEARLAMPQANTFMISEKVYHYGHQKRRCAR